MEKGITHHKIEHELRQNTWLTILKFAAISLLLMGTIALAKLGFIASWLGGARSSKPDFSLIGHPTPDQLNRQIADIDVKLKLFRRMHGDTATWTTGLEQQYGQLLQQKEIYLAAYNRLGPQN
jgi:hypothetical protein